MTKSGPWDEDAMWVPDVEPHEVDEVPCPICGERMVPTNQDSAPTWSDEYDHVVCWVCSLRVAYRT